MFRRNVSQKPHRIRQPQRLDGGGHLVRAPSLGPGVHERKVPVGAGPRTQQMQCLEQPRQILPRLD